MDFTSSVLQLACDLIACPSITPDDAGCQPLLAARLAKSGFRVESMRFADVDNLFAIYGNQAPLFVFAGHTDVVPTGPLSDWTSPPFQPTLRDGILYGRGASDMKTAIAAMVIAVEKFLAETPQFTGSCAFLITSDEEAQAINGTRKVITTLQERGIKIDYCLIGEPSSVQEVGDQIRVGRRGSLHGKLTIHGKQGHVAHPHLASNPIHLSTIALHELANTTWDHGNDHFPPTTFQITNIHSGTGATNVIPGHVDVLFNFRFGTASTIESLQAQTQAVFQRHGLTFDLHWELGGEPFLTPHKHLIALTQQAIKSVTGLDTQRSTGGGTSDGRFIAPTGAEVVELGVSHASAHQIDEHIDLTQVVRLTAIYYHLLQTLFLKKG